MHNRVRIRSTFNESAGIYDRVRPSYPDQIIEDAIALSKIPDGGRILEIGCGTGKATELFSSKGYVIDCLDIGTDLVSVALEKFKDNNKIKVIVSSFEDWHPNEFKYDLVLAAASLHWVDPAVRLKKSASILRSTGSLAILSNKHIQKNEGFFKRVRDSYNAYAPSMQKVAANRQKLWDHSVVGEDLFCKAEVRRVPWVEEYSAKDYVALLGTYSDHLSLPENERSVLFANIEKLIRDEFGGFVRKHYEASLSLRTVRDSVAKSRT